MSTIIRPPIRRSIVHSIKEVNSPKKVLDYINDVIWGMGLAVGFLLASSFAIILPVTLLAVGCSYLERCAVERYIPITLIVAGAVGIVKSIVGIVNRTRLRALRRKQNDGSVQLKTFDPLCLLDALLTTFLFAWFIAGSIWVFRHAYPEFYDTKSSRYCHRGLYLFTFVLHVIGWIMVGVLVVCFTGLFCYQEVISKLFHQVDKESPATTP